MWTKILGGVTGALLATTVLAGELTPGKPYEGTAIKVLAVNTPQFVAHSKKLDQFAEQTGIEVKYDFVPFPSMRETLAAEMVAGAGGYDLVSVMDQWVPSLSLLLEPIDEQAATHKIDLEEYPPAFLQAGKIGDELNGLPVRSHVQLLFYRKDIFEKHGLSVPKTWAEVVSVSKTLREKEGMAGIALPYGKNNGQNLMVWYNLLWAKGGKLFDEDGKPAFNSPEGVASIQDYIGFLNTEKVTPTGSASFNEQDALNSFKQGNSAMVPVWWWALPTMTNPEQSKLVEGQVGTAPLPSYEGAPVTTYTNSWIFGLTEGSKNKEAAMEFLTWLASPELERQQLLDPALRDVVAVQYSNLTDPEVNKRWGGLHEAAVPALRAAEPFVYTETWPQVTEVLEAAMSELASGTSTDAKAVLDAAAEKISAIR